LSFRHIAWSSERAAEKHQEEEVVDLLTATLEEEKQTDLKLTRHALEAGQGKGRLD
jgi:ferritin-like metal-binding protein YciE